MSAPKFSLLLSLPFLLRAWKCPGMLSAIFRILAWPPSRARYDRARREVEQWYRQAFEVAK